MKFEVGDKVIVMDIIQGNDVNLNGLVTEINKDYTMVDWYGDGTHIVRYDNKGYNHDGYIPTFIIKDLKPN